MKLRIRNKDQLDSFMKDVMAYGHGLLAIKGDPPMGATYDDGDPILNPVNVAWKDIVTGETCSIEYEEAP